jgi:hypothetical protein
MLCVVCIATMNNSLPRVLDRRLMAPSRRFSQYVAAWSSHGQHDRTGRAGASQMTAKKSLGASHAYLSETRFVSAELAVMLFTASSAGSAMREMRLSAFCAGSQPLSCREYVHHFLARG